MQIGLDTKIHDLLSAHPYLLDYLAGRAEEFKKLRNPILRNSIGRIASLKDAAGMAGIDAEALLEDVRAEIGRHADATGAAPADPDHADDREARIAAMKSLIRNLHAGGDKEQIKRRFAMITRNLDPADIGAMEQQLANEGLDPSEIKRMCEVHVEMFKEALAHGGGLAVEPGHAVHTFMEENRALGKVADRIEEIGREGDGVPFEERFAARRDDLVDLWEKLSTVEHHYRRKENQLFPFMEKHGIVAPTQVMWSVHDEIRAAIKETRLALDRGDATGYAYALSSPKTLQAVRDMFYKEEKILFPMTLDLLTKDEWAQVKRGEAEIGYAIGGDAADPAPVVAAQSPALASDLAALNLDTGVLSLEQINLMLTALPLDVSLVDENDEVRYYSAGPERIFPRSPAVIGRKVQNCHPPKSLSAVNRILADFRTGTRNQAEFWIEMGPKFIHIRYFALRGAGGTYRGCLEVTQDVTGIRSLRGSKRLLD